MSEHRTIVSGYTTVTCDICGRTSRSAPYSDEDDVRDIERSHMAHLTRLGWRVYLSRYRRHYCPHCAPSRGHRMRLIEGFHP